MKEYIRSFRTLVARSTIIQVFVTAILSLAVFTACTVSLNFLEDGSELKDFMLGFVPFTCLLLPTSVIAMLQSIFNCNNPITPGYKYFHSISGGAAEFRRAIMVGNVILLAVAALSSIIALISTQFVNYGGTILLTPGFSLAMTAICNFTGFSRNYLVRISIILPACIIGGFAGGFTAGYEDTAEGSHSFGGTVSAIIFAVCAAAAAAGIIFSALNAEKQWNRGEGEKIEKRA